MILLYYGWGDHRNFTPDIFDFAIKLSKSGRKLSPLQFVQYLQFLEYFKYLHNIIFFISGKPTTGPFVIPGKKYTNRRNDRRSKLNI